MKTTPRLPSTRIFWPVLIFRVPSTQRRIRCPICPHAGSEQHMGSFLHKRHEPHLRIVALAPLRRRTPEDRVTKLLVGDIQGTAVQAHEALTPVPGSPRWFGGNGFTTSSCNCRTASKPSLVRVREIPDFPVALISPSDSAAIGSPPADNTAPHGRKTAYTAQEQSHSRPPRAPADSFDECSPTRCSQDRFHRRQREGLPYHSEIDKIRNEVPLRKFGNNSRHLCSSSDRMAHFITMMILSEQTVLG